MESRPWMSYGSPVGIVISESPIAPISADCAVCDVRPGVPGVLPVSGAIPCGGRFECTASLTTRPPIWPRGKSSCLLQERMQLKDSDVILVAFSLDEAVELAPHGGDADVGGQERLGHSTISMTLDTYSHVLPSMQREAADKMDRLLRRRA